MKINKMLFVLIIPICGLLSSCLMSSESPKELTVLAWNIWHGGHSKAYPELGCKGTLDILKKSEADVILMIETYGTSSEVADHLGYYHRLLSSNLSIYSRYPITKTYVFPDSISTFNFGGVEIDMDGQKVRLFDTWLHYLPDVRNVPVSKSEKDILAWDDAGSRDDELRVILGVLEPFIAESDSIPIIMGGDFNSHSHLDWTEEAKDMYHHGGAVVNWTVSREMEEAGFKDSFREINPDPTKSIGTTWIHPNDENRKTSIEMRDDRIDYIYYLGNSIQAETSETYCTDLEKNLSFRGEEFFYASDHGFVLTKFRIEK